MSEKTNIYHRLFLCSLLCQGIIGTLSIGDVKKPSEFLVREKRVINLEPGGHVAARIETVPYIVNIQENGRSRCAGSILSNYNVITAERCFLFHVSRYKILSGAGYTHRGSSHNVTSKEIHFGNTPHRTYEGIALATVDPPFEYSRRTGFIHLYVGPLFEGTPCTVTGWGCQYPLLPPHNLDRKLRTISLPLMDRQVCENSYRGRVEISYKHVCTYHERKMCGHNDAGAPLVVNNMLAGIYVYKGESPGQINPDVYIKLQSDDYLQWIWNHSLLM